jgi:hypothetical protein
LLSSRNRSPVARSRVARSADQKLIQINTLNALLSVMIG